MICEYVLQRSVVLLVTVFFFFQAEDGIRDLVRSRGLGDVYKRQFISQSPIFVLIPDKLGVNASKDLIFTKYPLSTIYFCLLYTSDAADERSSVDLGGRRIIKKKNK